MVSSRIFVVIPAYNAEKTLEKVFADIPTEAAMKIMHYVVVNDGSTDNTDEVIMRLQRRYPNLTALNHDVNLGYGAAEKTLLHYSVAAGAETVLLLHADGQYSPTMILDLLKPIEEGRADIVQGSRLLNGGALSGGMPIYKFLANKCLTKIENWAFGMDMAEYHSGYMVYSRRALTAIPFANLSNSFDFDLEMIVMAKIKGLAISEVAIPTIYADEVSHLNPIKYGLDVLSVIKGYKAGKYDQL